MGHIQWQTLPCLQACDLDLLSSHGTHGETEAWKENGNCAGTGLGTPRTVLFPLFPTGVSASVSLTERRRALSQHSEEVVGALWAAELFPSMDLTRKVLRGVCGEARSHVLAWLCSLYMHAYVCVHISMCICVCTRLLSAGPL